MQILLSASADHSPLLKSGRRAFALFLAMGLLPLPAFAKPVGDLYNRVPQPPSNVREALRWTDSSGKIIEPAVAAYRIELEKESRTALTATTQAGTNATGNPMGIDVARLQSDPAYQQQVTAQAEAQAKQYQNMSQQQMIAAGMAQAAQTQSALSNDAMKTMQESPAVTQAVLAMRQTQMQWQLDLKSSPKTSLDASTALITQRYNARRDALEKQFAGHDGDCGDCSDAVVAKIQEKTRAYWRGMLELENQYLSESRAAFTQARASRAAVIAEGDRQLALVQYGAATKSQTSRQTISAYQTHLLTEAQILLDYSEAAARHATMVAATAKARAQVDP